MKRVLQVQLTQSDQKRQILLQKLAEHVLQHGLHSASLRPLAAAAGTSDRMLIYYFGSKDGMLAELLQLMATKLAQELTQRFDNQGKRATATFLRDLWTVVQSEELRPILRIWLEVAAVASREGGTKISIAKAIGDQFLLWLRSQLAHPADAEFTLTFLEGMLVLGEVGHSHSVFAALDRLDGFAAPHPKATGH